MTRTTLIYVVLLCVLTVASVLKLTMPGQTAQIAFKLPALKPEEITKVVVTKGDQSVTLERDTSSAEKAWRITAPFKYPADSGAVDSILKSFEAEVPMDLKMTEDEKDHDTYEVTLEKAVKLELYKGSDVEVAILIGKNASGGSSYIRPVNSNEVFRAKVGSRSRLDKKPEDWREKKIFNLKPEEITKLEIVGGPQPMTFTRANGTWTAEQPVGLQVDKQTVDAMARSFSTFRSASILEKAEGDTGLATPSMKVTATLPSGTKTLLIGGKKGEGELYAQREGDPQLFSVRDGQLAVFRKNLDDLRDKAVFHFDPEEIHDISVARGAKKVHLKLEGEGWKVVEPPGLTVDSKAVQSLMAGITTLRISSFAPGVDAKTAGFEQEPLQVTLGTKSGQNVGLTIGGEKEGGEFYARRVENPEVFMLREASVNNFKRILGEPVKTPPAPQGMAGAPGGMRLPPGVQLPPGLNLPQ